MWFNQNVKNVYYKNSKADFSFTLKEQCVAFWFEPVTAVFINITAKIGFSQTVEFTVLGLWANIDWFVKILITLSTQTMIEDEKMQNFPSQSLILLWRNENSRQPDLHLLQHSKHFEKIVNFWAKNETIFVQCVCPEAILFVICFQWQSDDNQFFL